MEGFKSKKNSSNSDSKFCHNLIGAQRCVQTLMGMIILFLWHHYKQNYIYSEN